MRCTKLSYTSPVFGSVQCEDLPEESSRYVDFGPSTAMALYEQGPEVLQFMTERIEDLAWAVPEELEGLVVKAVFGQLDAEGMDLSLTTDIYVRQEPTEEQHKQIIDWIRGQMSDGWGEGVEQRPAYIQEFCYESYSFDEDRCRMTAGTECTDIEFYLHPWANDSSWRVALVSRTFEELDIEEPDTQEELRQTVLKIKELVDQIVEELKNVT